MKPPVKTEDNFGDTELWTLGGCVKKRDRKSLEVLGFWRSAKIQRRLNSVISVDTMEHPKPSPPPKGAQGVPRSTLEDGKKHFTKTMNNISKKKNQTPKKETKNISRICQIHVDVQEHLAVLERFQSIRAHRWWWGIGLSISGWHAVPLMLWG